MQQTVGQLPDRAAPDIEQAIDLRGAAPPLLPRAPSASHGRQARAHKRDGGTRAPALWGLSGFVIGAVFWHFIGFWGFVSSVVFNGRARVEERYVEQTGSRCIELAVDRTTGMTRGSPCAIDAPLLDERSLTAKDHFQRPRSKVVRGGTAIRLSAGDR